MFDYDSQFSLLCPSLFQSIGHCNRMQVPPAPSPWRGLHPPVLHVTGLCPVGGAYLCVKRRNHQCQRHMCLHCGPRGAVLAQQTKVCRLPYPAWSSDSHPVHCSALALQPVVPGGTAICWLAVLCWCSAALWWSSCTTAVPQGGSVLSCVAVLPICPDGCQDQNLWGLQTQGCLVVVSDSTHPGFLVHFCASPVA